ncbi:MAG: PAS domain S-box protein, partial [Proteobacteria bacterium]|nr:PAS domain S-box protein [Pseudomonadota bacterium]
MTEKKTYSGQADTLRQRAEDVFREKAAGMPENVEALSPDEVRQALHELRVHQIRLEMQNEELSRMQAELEASRARYFDLYDLAPIGYFTLSEAGLIMEVNLTAANMLGVARGALVKQPLTRFILPEDRDIYCRRRKLLFETGAPQMCEMRMVKKDAAPFWAQMEARLAQNAEGAPVCRAVMSDITARKRVEAELQQVHDELEHRVTERTVALRRANEERRTDIINRKRVEEIMRRTEENFRRSLDDSPLGVRIVTLEDETIYANQAILDIYGYDSVEELRTTSIKNRYTPQSYAEFKIRRGKRKGDDGPSEYEISIVRKNGEVRHLQVFRKEILWDGERRFQVVYQDITARKQAEEE